VSAEGRVIETADAAREKGPLCGWETVELRDGMQVTVRPICPEDAPCLQLLFRRLSKDSIYYRFLGPRRELSDDEARRLADLDQRTRMALVATSGEGCEKDLIGVARYAVIPDRWPAEAEAAVVVEDLHQNKGLGTVLLQRLAAFAAAQGIRTFVAVISHDNGRILRLVQRSGLPAEIFVEAGVVALRVALEWERCADAGDSRNPERQSRSRQGGENGPVCSRPRGLACGAGRIGHITFRRSET